MLTTNEQFAVREGGKDFVLFSSVPLPDALANLAALTQCLCEIQQEHYGVNLLNCMIRDTLLHLSTRAFEQHSAPQGEASNA